MNRKFLQSQRGYIALMSAIVLSLVLVSLTAAASASVFYSRYNILNSEYKRVSLGLAESCANEVLLKAAQNFNYTLALDPQYNVAAGSVKIPVGTDAQGNPEYCFIKSANFIAVGNAAVGSASAQGEYHSVFSNIKVITSPVGTDNINIASWQESP